MDIPLVLYAWCSELGVGQPWHGQLRQCQGGSGGRSVLLLLLNG
ncbi:hypothetical protein P376_0219 [Streptomyces sp. HCCB10043]|nr:hypothetical protein P376_0219 [Streptomyces sp. HCCB10043]